MSKIKQLEKKAAELRVRLIQISHGLKIPHLGSCLSCVDILTSLYFEIMDVDSNLPEKADRDRFLLGKGHAANALYVALAYRGFFEKSLLDQIGKVDAPLEEHPYLKCVPGIENASGSLGHAFPIGVGIALAAKIKGAKYKVFVLIGDGEMNEGTVWESAIIAASQKLENLVLVVDFNKWQATDRSINIMPQPLVEKWQAFGWSVEDINGNNIKELNESFQNLLDLSGKPKVVIAHTIKGKGVSFMEDDNNWHYRIPTEEEVSLSKKELEL